MYDSIRNKPLKSICQLPIHHSICCYISNIDWAFFFPQQISAKIIKSNCRYLRSTIEVMIRWLRGNDILQLFNSMRYNYFVIIEGLSLHLLCSDLSHHITLIGYVECL